MVDLSLLSATNRTKKKQKKVANKKKKEVGLKKKLR
jgi:hypothetical protein